MKLEILESIQDGLHCQLTLGNTKMAPNLSILNILTLIKCGVVVAEDHPITLSECYQIA